MTTYEEKFQFLIDKGLDRLSIYRTLGYTAKAFDDEYWRIRQEAYRALGWNEKAFDDQHCEIKREAYQALGWNEKALDDDDWDIRREAKNYFKAKKLLENEFGKEDKL